jgi:hypothetical protein
VATFRIRKGSAADAPAVVAGYERQAFARSGRFDVRGWIGQVLTMRLVP